MPTRDCAPSSVTRPTALKGRKSLSHSFRAQVTPVMATGMADLVDMLDVVGIEAGTKTTRGGRGRALTGRDCRRLQHRVRM